MGDASLCASEAEMRYLLAIADGHRMPSELADQLGISRQAVSQMLQRLREAGYITLPGGIPSLTPIARQMVEATRAAL
jgi:Mn-dependent DtxR family transcriptional regulator